MASMLPKSLEGGYKSTSQLVNDIGLLHRQNLEIIQSIEKLWGPSHRRSQLNIGPKSSTYNIGFSGEGLFLDQESAGFNSFWGRIENSSAFDVELIEIPDRFNQCIGYKYSSFPHIKQLNEQMNNLAKCYAVFGDNPTSSTDLENIRQNLDTLKIPLKKFHQFLEKSDEQIRTDVQQRLDKINKDLQQILADYPSLGLLA